MENKIPSIFDGMLLFTLLDTSKYHLVGGLEHGCYFPFHIWDVILPIDFHSIIFQDGHIAPPTSHYFRKISRNCKKIFGSLAAPGSNPKSSSCWVGMNCCMNKWRHKRAAFWWFLLKNHEFIRLLKHPHETFFSAKNTSGNCAEVATIAATVQTRSCFQLLQAYLAHHGAFPGNLAASHMVWANPSHVAFCSLGGEFWANWRCEWKQLGGSPELVGYNLGITPVISVGQVGLVELQLEAHLPTEAAILELAPHFTIDVPLNLTNSLIDV